MGKIFEIENETTIYHFFKRINRFAVETREGRICHLHDPGRLEELLVKDVELYVIEKESGLGCEIISVRKGNENVFLNSRFHSIIARKIIEGNYLGKEFEIIRGEVTHGKSRIDFLLNYNNEEYYMEVKGCTLLDGKVARFPDAPTARGTKHVEELISLKNLGKDAGIMFLVFRDAEYFSPNFSTDKKFYFSLKRAVENGVEVFPVKVFFDGRNLFFHSSIDLKFDTLQENY